MRSEFHQIFISSSVFTLIWVRFCNLIKRRSDLTLPAPQLIQEVFLTQEQKKEKKNPLSVLNSAIVHIKCRSLGDLTVLAALL